MSGASSWLDQVPDADHERIASVLDDYLADLEQGIVRSPDELIARHPEWGDALRQALASLDAVRKVVAAFPSAECPPALPSLGDYRILREIGRGGMGIVYEARQLSLGRTVALKVLPFAAVLDPIQVQRFQNEAQAAAQLHHPHIVPVFAVGCERGVHYYSMQYIDGRSLDQVVRELRTSGDIGTPPSSSLAAPSSVASPARETVRGKSTHPAHRGTQHIRAMADLIAQAAEGLHYAHECGVIHRDIKPSNLLVDLRGKLSIADFGLARCQSLSRLTTQGQMCGTVRYMSPEQASGRGAIVDARSDIYGLGISLYELLALRTPFDSDDRETLLRQIVHEEPPSLRRLNPAIPVDLENVVKKAMAKERDERYLTAEELAIDLRRYLAGQPTLARQPGVWDRTAKWVARRAKWVAGAMIIASVSLVAAAAIATLVVRSQRQTQQALDEAERHLRVACNVVDDFSADLSEQLSDVPGAEPIRLATLARAAEFYRQFAAYAGDDPRWQQDAAIACAKRATVLEQLGDLHSAAEAYQEARSRFRELLIRHIADDPSYSRHVESALCDAQYGSFLYRRGSMEEGRKLLEQATQQLNECAARDRSLTTSKAVLRAQSLLAESYPADSHRTQRIALLEANERRARRGMAETPEDREFARRLAEALEGLALADSPSEQATARYREALDLRRAELQRQPASLRAKVDMAQVLHRFATTCAATDPRRAASLYAEARTLFASAVEQSPEDHALRSDLAVANHNAGLVALQLGDREQSDELLAAAARQQESALIASGYLPKYRDLLKKHEDHRQRLSRLASATSRESSPESPQEKQALHVASPAEGAMP